MPSVERPGLVGMYVELPTELRDRLRDFCKERGERIADQVRLAIERHLAYPPPKADIPPLPTDGQTAPPVRKRGRPRKNA